MLRNLYSVTITNPRANEIERRFIINHDNVPARERVLRTLAWALHQRYAIEMTPVTAEEAPNITPIFRDTEGLGDRGHAKTR